MSRTTCARCGSPVTPEAGVCMACGADLAGQAPSGVTRTEGLVAVASPPRAAGPTVLEQLQSITLGEYEILAELGRGGMATVFLAHDLQLDRKVAIKVMHPMLLEGGGTDGMVERFKQEARTAAGLSHPNIIPIYAVRDQGHLLWFVMKFVAGRPLDSIIAQAAPLSVPIVRTILGGVAEALSHAHRHGVVHRDVKPANIMIDLEGRPVVTDFGVAKVSDQTNLTLTGTAVGTPKYMSPEQCDAKPATGASDQYSLGVVGFEMLTGKPMYDGDSAVIIMFKHAYSEVPDRAAFGPHTPPDLADALIRMLQKDPANRWPALEDALPALRGDTVHEAKVRSDMATLAANGPQNEILARVSTPRSPTPLIVRTAVGARRPAAAPEPAPPVTRKPRWRWAAAAGAVLATGAALMLWQPWASDSAVRSSPPVPETTSAPPPAPAPSVVNPPPAAAVPKEAVPEAATVRGVRFLDPPATVVEGDSVSLRAEVLDQRGGVMHRPVTWTSSDPRTALVRAGGTLVALAPGRVAVSASAEGRQSRIDLEIVPVIASILVTPAADTLAPARSATLTASARRRDGSEVSGATIAWRSSDEAVAVVSSTGRVTALAPGSTTITATAAGRRGVALITVAAPAPAVAAAPPPPPPPPPPREDAQAAVHDLVAAYAGALEAKDMARVRALYPAMSSTTEHQTRSALEDMKDLKVRLSATGITVDGARAQARVTGEWTYRGGKPLEINNVYRFERRSSGWVIVAID